MLQFVVGSISIMPALYCMSISDRNSFAMDHSFLFYLFALEFIFWSSPPPNIFEWDRPITPNCATNCPKSFCFGIFLFGKEKLTFHAFITAQMC